MKLEDFEKLCNEAIESCFTFKVSNAQYEFYKSCHEMVPKLIAVAKAVEHHIWQCAMSDFCDCMELNRLLVELEKE